MHGAASKADIQSHTALRGIAALLVVAVHYRITLSPALDVDQFTDFFSTGYIWVDLFFILSGYILFYVYSTSPGASLESASLFFRARFARVYPLHVATLLFLAAWQVSTVLFSNASVHFGKWSTFWLNVVGIHAWGVLAAYDWNFPSWSISAEFAAYLCFPIICIGILRARRFTFSMLLLAVIARMIFVILVDQWNSWERLSVLRCLPMFFLGILLYRLRPLATEFDTQRMSALQIIAVTLIAMGLHYGWNAALLVLPFALLVFSTQTDTGVVSCILRSRPLVALGLCSYSIYMLHVPVRYVVTMIWPKFVGIPFGLTTVNNAAGMTAVAALITVGAASFSYKFFEIPAREYFVRASRLKRLG